MGTGRSVGSRSKLAYMTRIAFAFLVLLLVVSPHRAEACCMAPQPEGARLITPSLTQLPAGSGFVLSGSELVSSDVTLTGPATVRLTGTEIAPHVLRFVLPRETAPGRYDVVASYRGVAGSIGGLEVSARAPALAAPTAAPVGTLAHTESPGRWAPNQAITLTLATPTSHGVAVVFDWTVAGQHFGNVVWINAQSSDAILGGTGRCGGYPYGATLPGHGAAVRAAFIDERGQMSPWTTLAVR